MPDLPPILDDLATPCLLVERRRLLANLDRMQARADAAGVTLRPHVKTHKSTWIARAQAERGARGLTVAKPGEAEAFVDEGFSDVRLAYPVVGADKHARLVRLAARGAHISFCVDTEDGARMASDAWAAAGATADVLVEVDTGHGRSGVPWNEPADLAALARRVEALPGLSLAGLLTHGGHAYHGPGEGESAEDALRRAGREERDRLLAAAEALGAAGVESARRPDFVLSLGSTPGMTYFENAERDGRGITEVRPGNYVFYDATQVALGAARLEDCALTVLATVVSKRRDRAGRERLFLDAGKKILTSDTGRGTEGYGVLLYNPAVMTPLPHARLVGLSEEHGWVEVRGGATLAVGDRVRIVPNHACVAVNTQDALFLVDGQDVVERLSVDARGLVA